MYDMTSCLRVPLAVGAIVFFLATAVTADPIRDAVPPLLDDAGRAGYGEFTEGALHRAFAIAPGGTWVWVSDMPTPEVAESEALRECSNYTDQSCVIFAVDNQVVFDADAWTGLWGPYIAAGEAAARPVGIRRGERFPDLLLSDPFGAKVKLSDLRGKAVLFHIWGSWCPPCQVEFPELQMLYESLKGEQGITFVLVQSREDIEKSLRWAKRHGFSMPFYDSGSKGLSDRRFRKADGGTIEDRVLAPQFPSTYVLDKNGIIVFSHSGLLRNWPQYAPFLRHVASRSGGGGAQ
ncbi:MAG: redoxin domain-containing protein [Rhodospirillales bacterium]|nr:redoxin domain-containing protein [Rhodospirillales bacterium]